MSLPSTSAALPRVSQGDIELVRADPLQYPEQVCALFLSTGRRMSIERLQWYYRQARSIRSWVVRSRRTSDVLGLLSVIRREFRYGGAPVRVGVLGNFFIDQRIRGMVGFNLVRVAKSLVTDGDLDLILGVPNSTAAPLLTRLDFKKLADWETRVFSFRARSAISTHLGRAATVLAPMVDVGSAFVRLRRHLCGSRSAPGYTAIEVTRAELCNLPFDLRSHPGRRFDVAPSASYIESRYLNDPWSNYRVFAIYDQCETVCGYVVVNAVRGGFHLCECCTDAVRLSKQRAIETLCRHPEVRRSVLAVTAIRGSELVRSLGQLGAIRLPVRFGGYELPLLGFWRKDAPLAHAMAEQTSWGDLLIGWNDV